MSQWRIVRLNFGNTPVHFGEIGIGTENSAETVHSDTLYSAFISLYARVYGSDRVEALIQQLQSDPPFRLSSTFLYRTYSPIADRQQQVFYLPRPLIPPRGYPAFPSLSLSKQFQKYTYLPLDIWQRWYQGEGITTADIQSIEDTEKQSSSELKQTGLFDYSDAYQTTTTPNVALDRQTAASNFYQTGFVKYNSKPDDQSGLYFLIQLLDPSPELESQLHQIFAILGDEGLGGERSTGAGQFHIKDWSSILPKQTPWLTQWHKVLTYDQGNHHSLISLFWPETVSSDLVTSTTRYQLQERGGWTVGVPLRRKKVHMFNAGSVFSFPPEGALADVTPNYSRNAPPHKIYRSGLSMSLPISIQEESA